MTVAKQQSLVAAYAAKSGLNVAMAYTDSSLNDVQPNAGSGKLT